MSKKKTTYEEIKELLDDAQELVKKLKDEPDNDKIMKAVYACQTWNLKQITHLIEIFKRNKQK